MLALGTKNNIAFIKLQAGMRTDQSPTTQNKKWIIMWPIICNEWK